MLSLNSWKALIKAVLSGYLRKKIIVFEKQGTDIPTVQAKINHRGITVNKEKLLFIDID